MNRNAEYASLLRELETLEVPTGSVERALGRHRRSKYLLRPLAGLAAAFVLFAVLVNVSSSVAYACSRLPGLRELARAVTFSRSLSVAVEKEYVQPLGLSESGEGITVHVDYLIVDQSAVTVFYRLESERYPSLEAEPEFYSAEGGALEGWICGPNDWGVPNGQLRSLHIDFAGPDVPPALWMRLKLRDPNDVGPAQEISGNIWDSMPGSEPAYVAQFDFMLHFDPHFRAQGRHYEVDRSFTLDGQTVHITQVDVYPSYMSFTVEGDEANTAWLRHLDFYLVTDRGRRFDAVSQGITATGSRSSPEMTAYRADSAFFYGASSVKLCVTGAEWLDKDKERVRLDLKNGQADFLPPDTELLATERAGSRWVVTLLEPQDGPQPFLSAYYDAEGELYEFHARLFDPTLPDGTAAPRGMICESFSLEDYPYDQVWLTPDHTWTSTVKRPVPVEIPLGQE